MRLAVTGILLLCSRNKTHTMKLFSFALFLLLAYTASAQTQPAWQGKFEQLEQLLPTPNEYRSATGGPGPKYWQQRADYFIDAEIDEPNNLLKGKETITYY